MKTTAFSHSFIETCVARDDRQGLLELRQQVDEALRDLVPEHDIIGSFESLETFIKAHPVYRTKRMRVRHAYSVLERAVAFHWNERMRAESIRAITSKYRAFRKEQAREKTGFRLNELHAVSLFMAWNPPYQSTDDIGSPTYVAMLWDYLAQYGIFQPD